MRGDKNGPSLQMFTKLVNSIKHQKVMPSPQSFQNPCIPYLPKVGKNLMDPPPGIFKFQTVINLYRVHTSLKGLTFVSFSKTTEIINLRIQKFQSKPYYNIGFMYENLWLHCKSLVFRKICLVNYLINIKVLTFLSWLKYSFH